MHILSHPLPLSLFRQHQLRRQGLQIPPILIEFLFRLFPGTYLQPDLGGLLFHAFFQCPGDVTQCLFRVFPIGNIDERGPASQIFSRFQPTLETYRQSTTISPAHFDFAGQFGFARECGSSLQIPDIVIFATDEIGEVTTQQSLPFDAKHLRGRPVAFKDFAVPVQGHVTDRSILV